MVRMRVAMAALDRGGGWNGYPRSRYLDASRAVPSARHWDGRTRGSARLPQPVREGTAEDEVAGCVLSHNGSARGACELALAPVVSPKKYRAIHQLRRPSGRGRRADQALPIPRHAHRRCLVLWRRAKRVSVSLSRAARAPGLTHAQTICIRTHRHGEGGGLTAGA